MPDLTPDDIAEAAAAPASASTDAGSASAHSIPDQIAAAKFQAAGNALDGTNDNGGPKSGWNKLRTARVRTGGAV